MNFKIAAIFWLCHSAYIPHDQFFDKLGVYTSIESPVDFFDTHITVYLTRTYSNTLCTEGVLGNVTQHVDCLDRKVQAALKQVVAKLAEECDRIWKTEINKLRATTPQSRQTRNYADPSEWPVFDSGSDDSMRKRSFAEMMTSDNVASPTRRKRQAAAVLTGLNSLLSIAPTLVTTFSSLYMFFSHREVEKQLSFLKTETRERQTKANLATASIMREFDHSIDALTDTVCQRDVLTNSKIRQLNANILLAESISATTREILAFSYSEAPRSAEFLSVLLNICTKVKANDIEFCKRIIFNQRFSLRFDGTTIRDGLLVALIKLELPVRSENFVWNRALHTLNVGAYHRGEYFQLNVPSFSMQTPEGNVFDIDISQCQSNLCHTNDLQVTPQSRCLTSLLRNSSESCVRIFTEAPDCLYYKVPSGYIIMAPKALWVPEKLSSGPTIRLNKSVFFTREAGTLICNNHGINSTHKLQDPMIHITSNTSLSTREKINIIHRIDLSDISSKDDLNKEIRTKISELEQSDDLVLVGKNDLPIVLVCFVISITTSFILLLINGIFKYRSAIASKILQAYISLKSKIWAVQIAENAADSQLEMTDLAPKQDQNKSQGNRLSNHLGSQHDLELVNGEHRALYPSRELHSN